MLLRLLALLAFLGFGVAAWKEESYFLPPTTGGRIIIALLALLLFSVAVETAHRLHAKIDEINHKFSGVPVADRDLIIRLRTVAGRATDLFTSRDPLGAAANRNVERLQRIGGNLRHYPKIYSASRQLLEALKPLEYREGRTEDFMNAVRRAEESYSLLLAACASVLTPAPDQP